MFLMLSLYTIAPTLAQSMDNTKYSTSHTIPAIMHRGQLFLGVNGTGGIGRGGVSTIDTWSGTGQIGYFLAQRWVTGVQLTYGSYHATNNLAGTSSYYPQPFYKRNEVNITPEVFTRYYFTNWKVKPFVQASAGWNFATGKYTQINGENSNVNGNNFAAKAALGVSFKLGQRATIDLLYDHSLTKSATIGEVSGLRLGVSFLVR